MSIFATLRHPTFRLGHAIAITLFACFAEFLHAGTSNSSPIPSANEAEVFIEGENYRLKIELDGFRFRFTDTTGKEVAPAHVQSGLLLANEGDTASEIASAHLLERSESNLLFKVATGDGLEALVKITLGSHRLKISIDPVKDGSYDTTVRIGSMGPAYGMADFAAIGEGGEDLELKNFVRDPLVSNRAGHRMESNFVIFPQEGFAMVNIEPGRKAVYITDSENAQGSRGVRSMPAMYFFVGTPEEIYQAFLETRNEEGYSVHKPKHEWFGVGWEAFGALAWMTSHQTVTQNIDQYLTNGYPLEWMVVGSGFWPRGKGEFDEHGTPYGKGTLTEEEKKLQATTSFGMWDKNLYPNPRDFIESFHQKGLIFTIGLRIGFIPGGPFTEQGLKNGYFIGDENAQPQLFKVGFPRTPVYLLDAQNEKAVEWYVDQATKWLEYGVDGFKEDLFHWPASLRDDLVNPINDLFMERGVHIMARCNYLGSPADIHRYQDFNYNQVQDRGPINGLAYAFSGFPNVYPDIIGGTGLATGRFGNEPIEKLRTYIIRYAQYASLNPSMAFGYGPWNFDEETNLLCLAAAKRHNRLKPYIYSNAVRAYETGFPYPMTPLPLAYPDDPEVYGLASVKRKGYQWLIGESLLAAPLYGDDYQTAFARDIYLPAGTWIDYDTGERYEGPQTLEHFPIPLNKSPLFVGGAGFVVEQEGSQLFARIYPINTQSRTTFVHKDGTTKSEFDIDVTDWNALRVTESGSGKSIDCQFIRHAYQFPLEPGKNYDVR